MKWGLFFVWNDLESAYFFPLPSVLNGVNTRIIQELLDYLQTENNDPYISTLIDEFSLQHINPVSARKLRRIVIRYKFFESPPEVDMENIEQRNNYLDQYRQYKRDVENFGHHIHTFCTKKFTSAFTNWEFEVKIWQIHLQRFNVQSVRTCGSGNRIDDCARFRTFRRSGKDPILTTDAEGTDRVFCTIVIDGSARMF